LKNREMADRRKILNLQTRVRFPVALPYFPQTTAHRPGSKIPIPVYIRGLAHLKAAQGGNFPLESLAHLQLARARAMSQNNDAARRAYQDFLALWKNAEPDIPILRQAKMEYRS
jgi:hypothetical protein